MKIFLIYCVPSLPIGILIAAMVSNGTKTKMKHIIKFALATVVITAFCAGEFTLNEFEEQKIWNNGICTCGGEYKFINGSRYRNTTTYYYECDNCGDVLELQRHMK